MSSPHFSHFRLFTFHSHKYTTRLIYFFVNLKTSAPLPLTINTIKHIYYAMQVKDAMNPKVIVANDETTIKEAARIMAKYKIGSLVIVEGKNKIIGIMTESDIISKVVATGENPSNTKIEQVMTKKVITIDPDKDLSDACHMMVENKVKRFPVVENDILIGIITATDIIAVEPKMIEQLAKVMMVSNKQIIAG